MIKLLNYDSYNLRSNEMVFFKLKHNFNIYSIKSKKASVQFHKQFSGS